MGDGPLKPFAVHILAQIALGVEEGTIGFNVHSAGFLFHAFTSPYFYSFGIGMFILSHFYIGSV